MASFPQLPMRKITELCIHHSYTDRDQELDKSIQSFNDSHYLRLHVKHGQPVSGVAGSPHCAYHFVIAGNGDYKQTRKDEIIGYHASNIEANKRSVAIVLTGNFDREKPTDAQLNSLREIVAQYKAKYPIEKITGHRNYAAKSCPGLHFPDELINSLMQDEAEPFPEWAIPLVRHIKRNGVKTDLHTKVGDLHLYHLLAVIAKADVESYSW